MSQLAESKLDYLLEQPGYPEVPKRENLQVRPISREGDLGWLAGIIDGEGNLHCSVQEKPCGNTRRSYFEPKLRISNTDVRMIKRVSEIYVSEGLTFFYAFHTVSRYKNKQPTWKDQLEITISSKAGCLKALRLVHPYLVNKQRFAEMMIELVEWVHAQPYRGRNSSGSNYTEAPEFKAMINALERERKDLIEPSTTLRRAREVLSW
jgi:hypothetical protein